MISNGIDSNTNMHTTTTTNDNNNNNNNNNEHSYYNSKSSPPQALLEGTISALRRGGTVLIPADVTGWIPEVLLESDREQPTVIKQ